jgi:hypothetical protein
MWFRRLVLVSALIAVIWVFADTPPLYVRAGLWVHPSLTSTPQQRLVPVANLRTLAARWTLIMLVTGLLLAIPSPKLNRSRKDNHEASPAGGADRSQRH